MMRFKVEADYANEINELKRLVIGSGPDSIKDRNVADIILYKLNKTDIQGFQPAKDAVLDPEDTLPRFLLAIVPSQSVFTCL